VGAFEEGAEIGVRRDALRFDHLDGALEERFFSDVAANERQRSELLQRA